MNGGGRSTGGGDLARVESRLDRGGPARAWTDRLSEDEGSATAEYAIATMAAVGFAGLLVVILKGDEVRGILTDLVTRALTAAG
ncbi:DUF4244 domain-containing protein [Rathayibacter tanaceti]|nr:DUF4244 domain-containing protein [Rathayibacter tanaceti]